MTTIHVASHRFAPTTPPAAPAAPMTRIGKRRYAPTFTLPVSRPGEDVRRELWSATSVDNLWRYDRQDDERSTWTITYLPTDQARGGYGAIRDARTVTAGPDLIAELTQEAAQDAVDADRVCRTVGQYRLGVHMRLAGADEADARCECGGILVNIMPPGRGETLVHIDACAKCWTYGQGYHQGDAVRRAGWGCPGWGPHRICTDPRPVQCGHWAGTGCATYALPADGAGCEGAEVGECCRCCVPE